MNECDCGTKFNTKLAPCPDGREGCCVAHFDKDSYRCPGCGKDLGPEIWKALSEGRVEYKEGVAIVNVAAVKELEFVLTEPCVVCKEKPRWPGSALCASCGNEGG